MSDIILDYTKCTELFDKVAEKYAKIYIENSKRNIDTQNQLRNFYDYVLDLLDKANEVGKAKFETEILPFVKMLNSKVAYSVGRKHSSNEFKTMINDCVSQVKTIKDLENFKLFFEAVLGFSKEPKNNNDKKDKK